MRHMRFAMSAALLAIGSMLSLSSHAQAYTVLDLGEVDGRALNDSGQVAGLIFQANNMQAFYTGANGLGITYLSMPNGISNGAPRDINKQGQIVGTFGDSDGLNWSAFISAPNAKSAQSINSNGVALLDAYGINSSGQVAGTTQDGHAALVNSKTGQVTVLGSENGSYSSSARGLNDNGQVVGNFFIDSYETHAFVSTSNGLLKDLGTFGGATSSAWAINNSGWVVGSASTADYRTHAFMASYDGNALIDLTPLAAVAEAYGINDSGQIVGYSTNVLFGDFHAFITCVNGQGLVDLNSLVQLGNGNYLRLAIDINNAGQILASGSNGHTYLLTPGQIPEPGTVALWMLGLLGVGVATRRQRH